MRRPWLAASLPALALLLVSAWSFAEHSPSSRYVPYQGQLQLGGAPVDDTVAMTFSFYDVQSGGTALDTVALDVEVSAGRFAVDVGPVADSVFDEAALYLGVSVEGIELPERQVIRAVPYAMHAQVGESFKAGSVVAGSVSAGSLAASSLNVSGNATVNNIQVGDMGHGTSWAGFRHASISSGNTGYAVLQNNSGSETLVNTAPGGQIGFRVGNVSVASLNGAGDLDVNRVLTGDGTAIGGLNVTEEYVANASMTAGVSLWSRSISTIMTSSSSGFCALIGYGGEYTSGVFTTAEYANLARDCDITDNGTSWVLTASAGRAWHGHGLNHECRARCVSWE